MIKFITLVTICSFMITGCSSKDESPLITTEVIKDGRYIEDIVYCTKDGKKNILFKHTYFLSNDSISYYQKDYLNVGVKLVRNAPTSDSNASKSIQWTIMENTEVVKQSINQILKNSISNYKIENKNSARMSIGFNLLKDGDDWLVIHADKNLSTSSRLPEYILEEVSSKGITQIIHTRVISDSREVLSSSKVYSSI